MARKIATAVRWMITIALLVFFVYPETGIYTTITLMLIAVGVEVNSYLQTLHTKMFGDMTEVLALLRKNIK